VSALKTWRAAAALSGRGLAWWLRELRLLLPARLRHAVGGAGPVLAVTPDRSGGYAATLFRPGHDPETVLPPGADEAALLALAGRLRSQGRPPRLAVVLADALTTRLALPTMADADLGAVLTLDLDRQTPLRPDEAVFTWRVLRRDDAQRRMMLALTVAPRAALDRAQALAARLGLRLGHAGPASSPPWPDDLLDRSAATAPSSITAPAWALAAALLLVALALPTWRAEQALAGLERDLVEARGRAEAVAGHRDRLAAAVSPAAGLRSLGEAATPLLTGLTISLPDEAHLRRLALRDGRLEIIGTTTAGTAALAVRLAAEPRFGQVEFRAPVVADSAGREQFHLSLSPVEPR
jgi:general secretion pathway protein L